MVKAISARLRFSVSVAVGIESSTWTICSSVGTRIPARLGDSRVVVGQIEIVRIGEFQLRPVARLVGEPFEEGLQAAQSRIQRCLAQPLAGAGVDLFGEPGLEPLCLFGMECLEVAIPRVGFKAIQGFGDAIQRGLAVAVRLLQKIEIAALDAFIVGMVRLHGFQRPFKSHNSGRADRTPLGAAIGASAPPAKAA